MQDQYQHQTVQGNCINEPDPIERTLGDIKGGMAAQIRVTLPQAMRDISIHELSHGYVVTVGCQSFAIESSTSLVARLAEYINNPAATEQKWHERKLF